MRRDVVGIIVGDNRIDGAGVIGGDGRECPTIPSNHEEIVEGYPNVLLHSFVDP